MSGEVPEIVQDKNFQGELGVDASRYSEEDRGPGQGFASTATARVSGPDDPKAKEQAERAGVSPEEVAAAQNTGTASDNIPYDKKKQGGKSGGSMPVIGGPSEQSS